MNADLAAVLAELTLLERAVLVRRHGLDGRHIRTLREVAYEFDLTSSQVEDIEKRAVLKAKRIGLP